MSEIKVLRIRPGKAPEAVTIKNSLKSLQHEVSGYIEISTPFEDPVVIICNEEGKISQLPCNRALRDKDGNIIDVIAGTFLIAGVDGEEFTSLTPDLIAKYEAYYHTPERFTERNGRITALPVK